MQKTIGVAVVGYGMSAQVFHLPFLRINKNYSVRVIVQRTGNEALKAFPDCRIYSSFSQVLTDDEIDLVVITTPNDTHFPFATAALEAGKHVVVEKPFTNTATEAALLLQTAKESGKVLSVYQNRRYVSDFRTIVHLLQNNMLGNVHEYICHFDRFRPEAKPNAWREKPLPGSGILYDLGSHLIDQALCLFGLPEQVTAFVKQQRPHALIDDYFDIRLNFGYTTAILKSSMLVKEMGPRYQVHGDLGSYIKSGDDPQEALLKEGAIPDTLDWGIEPESINGVLHTFFNGHTMHEKINSLPGNFGEYYQHLYSSIADGKPATETPEHGFNTIKIIELALQSSHEQRTINCEGLQHVPYPFALPLAQ